MFYILNSNCFPLSRRTAWNGLDWSIWRHREYSKNSVNICILIVAYFELWLLWLFCVNSIYWFLCSTQELPATTYIEISWLPCCRSIRLFAALAVSLGFISIDQRAKKKRKKNEKIANKSYGRQGLSVISLMMMLLLLFLLPLLLLLAVAKCNREIETGR